MLILNSAQTKLIEELTVKAGIEHIKLMDTAGVAVARFTNDKYGANEKSIAVVCGRGNNGGDGFVAAKKLSEGGAKVRVILASGHPSTDDAMDLLGRSELAGIKTLMFSDDEEREEVLRTLAAADIIIDAVYGTGFHGELTKPIAELFRQMNLSRAQIVSVDIPSGVYADSGEYAEGCINADCTVTFTTMKPAHVIYPGASCCSVVYTAPIGIDPEKYRRELEDNGEPLIETVDYQSVRLCFAPRRANTHKGDYGKLLCLCGSANMPGAAILSAKAAVQSGVGLVKLAVPSCLVPIIASHLTDPVYLPLKESRDGTVSAEEKEKLLEAMDKSSAVLAGCGMGVSEDTRELVKAILEGSKKPVVLDADALTCVSEDPTVLFKADAPVVITPHPGEMARLCGKSTEEVQKSRASTARSFAERYKVTVVLKGANTLIALPDGRIFVNLTGNPGMSKAGSGDVLAGLIGSLLAQGLSAEDAATSGVYIHGTCGDFAAKKYSLHAMTPQDIIFEFSALFLEIER